MSMRNNIFIGYQCRQHQLAHAMLDRMNSAAFRLGHVHKVLQSANKGATARHGSSN
jgi:hypothetical protein